MDFEPYPWETPVDYHKRIARESFQHVAALEGRVKKLEEEVSNLQMDTIGLSGDVDEHLKRRH